MVFDGLTPDCASLRSSCRQLVETIEKDKKKIKHSNLVLIFFFQEDHVKFPSLDIIVSEYRNISRAIVPVL